MLRDWGLQREVLIFFLVGCFLVGFSLEGTFLISLVKVVFSFFQFYFIFYSGFDFFLLVVRLFSEIILCVRYILLFFIFNRMWFFESGDFVFFLVFVQFLEEQVVYGFLEIIFGNKKECLFRFWYYFQFLVRYLVVVNIRQLFIE